jgi:hypothetical protein
MHLEKRFLDVFLPRQGDAARVPESELVCSTSTASIKFIFRYQALRKTFLMAD